MQIKRTGSKIKNNIEDVNITNRTDRSYNQLLNINSSIQSSRKEKKKSFVDVLHNKIEDEDEDERSVLSEEGINLKDYEDFKDLKLTDKDNLNEESKILKNFNLVEFLNAKEKKRRFINSPLELFENLFEKNFLDENSPYDIEIVNVKNINIQTEMRKCATVQPQQIKTSLFSLKKTPTIKKNTILDMENTINDNDQLIFNTDNSIIKIKQLANIQDNEIDEAINIKLKYNHRKKLYEVNLLEKLVEKFEKSKNDANSVEFSKPYQVLLDKTKKLKNKYQNDFLNINIKNNQLKVLEIKYHARQILIEFMKEIKKAVDEKDSGGKVKPKIRYIYWKKKISELVNIWNLLELGTAKVKYKLNYLLTKYFILRRAELRNLDKEFLKLEENNDKDGGFHLDLNINPLNLFKKDDSMPRMLIEEEGFLRVIIDLCVTFLLLYVLLTIPLRFFLNADNPTFGLIGKFVDMALYIDMILYFRTSYKDKTNNTIIDFDLIALRYFNTFFIFDLISSMPWSLYFIWNESLNKTVKISVHVTKSIKILRLIPLLSKLEKTKAKNYFRMIKLTLLYFLITHWMCCLLYLCIDNAIIWTKLESGCYTSNLLHNRNKGHLTVGCRYLLSFFEVNFMVPGQYTTTMTLVKKLVDSTQYIMFIIFYLIGYLVYAYAFGGVTSILQNLNQGQNIFTAKTDLLRDHMTFYDIDEETQIDIKSYYDYLWLRHQDIIYGKSHFDFLTKSLRQKFESLNFVCNEIYLSNFYLLGNPKLVDEVLINLRKIILFPYEILFHESEITKGIYILLSGEIYMDNPTIEGVGISEEISIDYKLILRAKENEDMKLKEAKKRKTSNSNTSNTNNTQIKKDLNVTFPFIPALIKTGRNWQRCSSKDFTDLLFLPLEQFDKLVLDFPTEIYKLEKKYMDYAEKNKLLDNPQLFNVISQHSSRSVGKYYEKTYNKNNIWIPITVSLIQRKLSTNYVNSYIKRMKNMWKEILIFGDINICLNGFSVLNRIKTNKIDLSEKSNEKTEDNYNKKSNSSLDAVNILTVKVDQLVSHILNNLNQ